MKIKFNVFARVLYTTCFEERWPRENKNTKRCFCRTSGRYLSNSIKQENSEGDKLEKHMLDEMDLGPL